MTEEEKKEIKPEEKQEENKELKENTEQENIKQENTIEEKPKEPETEVITPKKEEESEEKQEKIPEDPDFKVVNEISLKAPEGYNFGFPKNTKEESIKYFYRQLDDAISKGDDFEISPNLKLIGVDSEEGKMQLDPTINYAVQFPDGTEDTAKQKFWENIAEARRTGQGFILYNNKLKFVPLGNTHKLVKEKQEKDKTKKEGKLLGVG